MNSLRLLLFVMQVLNRRSKKLFGEEDVLAKFGVRPFQLCDLRALSGDKAVRLEDEVNYVTIISG
jgi:5'-3' exonuclease